MAATDTALAAMAACVAAASDCPIVLVSAREGERHRLVIAHGLALGSADLAAPSFCREILLAGTRLESQDTLRDPRFASDAMVTGAPQVRFFAGVPLQREGAVLGTLCVMGSAPRQLSAAQSQALDLFARAVAEWLHERRRDPEMRNERRRLRDFARASGDWMWETDGALRYTWISDAFEAVVGEPAASKIGHRLADGQQLDSLGQPLTDGRTLYALLRSGRPFSRALTEDSTPRGRRVISRSAVPVLDERGQLLGWRGTCRDVTEVIAQARQQRSQDELLKRLSDHAPGVIFQLRHHRDGEFRFEFVNERVVDLFGLTPGQLVADARRFEERLHPEDRGRVLAAFAGHDGSPRPLQHEYRVALPGGGERWLSSTASPEALASGDVVWRGFVADITERKHIELALRASEERWEIAAQANGIGIAQIDLASGRMTLDRRACANHGLAYPHLPFFVSDWTASIHTDDRSAAEAALDTAIRHTGHLDTRCRFHRPDGGQPWLEIVARLERDNQGRPASLIGTCRDVTEHVAVEVLRQEKESAERASQAKSEFLSRVSHELRTPLNGILGFAQLMALDRENELAEEQQLRLEGVQRSGEHLLALINDVLDIARIEQDDFRPRLHPVDVIEAATTCLAMIQPLAAARGVVLNERLPRSCWVLADPRGLEQVLINLLSNAIKFNRVGGQVLVDVATQGERVVFAVQDEGAGLSEEQQAQLFQPFNRLGAERRRIEGNGLGLVISRQLARAMQGELRVASRAGAGCRFTLDLPAVAAPDDHPATVPSALRSEPEPDGPQRHVLYIEDEPLNVVLMEEVFRRNPHWVLHTARDGAEGLQMAYALMPDLLLIDINLPDTSGIAIIRQLRQDPATAHLHCIALSADAMHEQIIAARAAGFDDYWTKPIDVAHLMRTVSGSLFHGRVA
jgi:PAS domain S-box-containing protein